MADDPLASHRTDLTDERTDHDPRRAARLDHPRSSGRPRDRRSAGCRRLEPALQPGLPRSRAWPHHPDGAVVSARGPDRGPRRPGGCRGERVRRCRPGGCDTPDFGGRASRRARGWSPTVRSTSAPRARAFREALREGEEAAVSYIERTAPDLVVEVEITSVDEGKIARYGDLGGPRAVAPPRYEGVEGHRGRLLRLWRRRRAARARRLGGASRAHRGRRARGGAVLSPQHDSRRASGGGRSDRAPPKAREHPGTGGESNVCAVRSRPPTGPRARLSRLRTDPAREPDLHLPETSEVEGVGVDRSMTIPSAAEPSAG